MPIIKKLVFALPFLLTLFGVYQYLGILLQNIYLIFDFNIATLIQLAIFLLLMLLSSLFFVVFTTLAQDLKITLPGAFLGAFSALIILPIPSALVITLGSLVVFILILLSLNKKLATYLTFQPTNLLIPSIRKLVTLLLLVFAISFYLAADSKIKTEGLQIPDSLLNPIINMSLSQLPNQNQSESQAAPSKPTAPQISPEQLQLLKQNPQLLKQYGLDPSILDQINTQQVTPPSAKTQPLEQNLVKTEVKKQLQNIIAPQINLIPPILAVLFFFTFQFGLTLFSVILSPLLWLIFWVLEKTGFIKYEKEMREVKKLIV